MTEQEGTQNKITLWAIKQVEAAIKYRANRMKRINLCLDSYNNKPRPELKHRSNLIIPSMGGFVDTLKAKIHNGPRIKYGYKDLADLPRSQAMQAAYEQITDINHDAWNIKDLAACNSAIFTARAISKMVIGGKLPSLAMVDPFDFLTLPGAPGMLHQHRAMGEINLLRAKYEIEQGVKDGIYDAGQVTKLLSGHSYDGTTEKTPEMSTIVEDKKSRLRALGLNPDEANYDGAELYNLCEWYTIYEGKWWYILYDIGSQIWIRCEELGKIYLPKNFGDFPVPYSSWSPFFDYFNFWPKAPVEDFLYTAEGIQLSVNQLFDSVNELLWPQILANPEMLYDMTELQWEPRGIIRMKNPAGTDPRAFVQTFSPSADKNAPIVTMNLVRFLKGLTGQDTGVTADAQGASDEKRVGIMVGNLQQLADRMRLYDDLKKGFWARNGLLLWQGMRQNVPEKYMVNIIGTKGVGWEKRELSKGDLNPVTDFDITVTGGDTEAQMDELKKEAQRRDEDLITANPLLIKEVNTSVLVETIFARNHDTEEVRRLMDKGDKGDRELIAKAEQAIQDIMEGKEPKLVYGATMPFKTHIVEFARDHKEEMTEKQFRDIVAYAEKHTARIVANTIEKAKADAFANLGAVAPQPEEQNPFMPQQPEQGPNPAMTPPSGNPQPDIRQGAQSYSNALR